MRLHPLSVRCSSAAVAALGLFIASGCGSSQRATQAGGSGVPAPAAARNPTNAQPQQGGQSGATEDVRTSDLDNDGRPEVFKYYKTVPDPERPGQQKTVLVRQDLDVNWDGKIDIWRYFNEAGIPMREEWDTDFDGNVDETRYFEEGTIAKSERDRNNDGRADVTRYYREGVLERKESDTNGDGSIDRWEYYKGRVLDRVGVDKDYDGTVDAWAKSEPETPS